MNTNRMPFIAGNWKMYKTIAEARQLVSDLITGLQNYFGVEIVVCPPFTALLPVRALLEGSRIGLGAQNLYWEKNGPFTGEVSPEMLAELCQYVIIGHSERRTFFGETDSTVNRKINAALIHGLKPIVCIGETLEENDKGLTDSVLTRQLHDGLAGIQLDCEVGSNSHSSLIIAYEPVWAIGTGRASTAENANMVIGGVIRPLLAAMYGEGVAQKTRILYGGSVKANNAKEFFIQPDIDGALVGGASLNAEEFIAIVAATL